MHVLRSSFYEFRVLNKLLTSICTKCIVRDHIIELPCDARNRWIVSGSRNQSLCGRRCLGTHPSHGVQYLLLEELEMTSSDLILSSDKIKGYAKAILWRPAPRSSKACPRKNMRTRSTENLRSERRRLIKARRVATPNSFIPTGQLSG